ncbi:MAG: hypothetical protein KAT56_00660 [Sedimentisphaerales bacterium]|nr:hypothetical protein [Sedimentisphaerales bacterium]
MQPDSLNVFDLDGTLIRVNSFKEISKVLVRTLFRSFKIIALGKLTIWYIIRKLHIVTHLQFKQRVVDIFENSLDETKKRAIVQRIFNNNINHLVFDLMLKAKNCIISTASPYVYTSRMDFRNNIVVISSLEPQNNMPDPANFGAGKIENIRAYFDGKDFRVVNFYTDSDDDQALIDFSVNAFIFRNDRLIKIK